MKKEKKDNYVMLRDREVVKANDLIQKSRFSLSLVQQKIILFVISQINTYDEDFKEYEFDIKEFCKVVGIEPNNGGNYLNLKRQIQEIRNKSLWIRLPSGRETLLAWIEKASIIYRETEQGEEIPTGKLLIRLDNDMKPYLLRLKENFTRYELIYTLRFRSRYSIKLYELVKSIHYHDLEPYEKTYTIEELKRLLDAEKYDTYQHFRERVLDTAIEEINKYSDKLVSYQGIREGRKISAIRLRVESKNALETIKIRAEIDREMSFDPNQISLWDGDYNE